MKQPKAKRDQQSEDFRHMVTQYLIRCADHVIALAPLPEFKDALAILRRYDEYPSKVRRKELEKTYRKLRQGRTNGSRSYGYTPIGEIYHGLVGAIWIALHRTNRMNSSDTVHFAEAKYCAVSKASQYIRPHLNELLKGASGALLRCYDLSSTVLYEEHRWQSSIYRQLSDEYHQKWDKKTEAA